MENFLRKIGLILIISIEFFYLLGAKINQYWSKNFENVPITYQKISSFIDLYNYSKLERVVHHIKIQVFILGKLFL
ncbi:hypothetical protein B5M19_00655 [Mesomycoplasma hyopneumoniae]|uniref:hypothetical protein n=1 Tax=Mesomycoplasma hyopneumoniae TaxID=2099 RepID=UPI00030F4987|nr:hypothetical protein [Mesomycoplasma hyopneumoniae]OWY74160.1 hypothetical protein B5M19_00655 [Mesomycoplasma hyopneumoniae]